MRKANLAEAEQKDLRALLSLESKAARYAWRVLGQVLSYAASLVGDAAEDVYAIDEAMRLGYNWRYGPFELIDRLGTDWLADRLQADGLIVPPALAAARARHSTVCRMARGRYLGMDGAYHPLTRPAGVLLLEDIKRGAKPVLKNSSAAVWDIGDGVLCFEYTSKSNSLDAQNLELLNRTIDMLPKAHKALVIYNEGQQFFRRRQSRPRHVRRQYRGLGRDREAHQIRAGCLQGAEIRALPRWSPRPPAWRSAAAARSCCIAPPCRPMPKAISAWSKCGVGLVPGWGGCKEMLTRWRRCNPSGRAGRCRRRRKCSRSSAPQRCRNPRPRPGSCCSCAPSDGITMNRDRLLADAKAKALGAGGRLHAAGPADLRLPGPAGRVAMGMAAEDFRAERRGHAIRYGGGGRAGQRALGRRGGHHR